MTETLEFQDILLSSLFLSSSQAIMQGNFSSPKYGFGTYGATFTARRKKLHKFVVWKSLQEEKRQGSLKGLNVNH